jgi:peptidoglycan/LPS O-acetylase OafA/YrhL
MRDDRLSFLDGLRGFAAFYVMIFHARWLLWEGYFGGYAQHPDLYPPLERIIAHLFLPFSFGGQVVTLFFVLSGFVIHLRYARQHQTQGEAARFDLRDYFTRRWRRLYPPLLLALAFTFVLDQIGIAAGFAIYTQPTVLNLDFVPNYQPTTLIGNLLFVNTVYVPNWGSNGPLWSLMYEAWFYMLYPLFWRINKRSVWWAAGALVALTLLSQFPSLWIIELLRVVFSRMLQWWMGALLAEVYVGRIGVKLWHVGLLSSLLLIMLPLDTIMPVQSPDMRYVGYFGWALAFTGMIAALLAWVRRGGSLRWVEALNPLAAFSYTLYVTHTPIQFLISGWLMHNSVDGTLPRAVWWVFLGIILSTIFAYAAHFVVERPFLKRSSPRTVVQPPSSQTVDASVMP